MVKKSGLGRGLSALIPGGESTQLPGGINYVPIDQIDPNPYQPRTTIELEELKELSSSILEHGLLQPLVVSYDEKIDRFILIAGGRRLLAARKAGLDLVPVMIREVSEEARLELALVENLQRTDLNPMEAADAYQTLSEKFHLNHEEIAARVGKSRTAVSNTLRLVKLPAAIKQAILEHRISEGHARAILALDSPQAQLAALNAIEKEGLNVRQAEELVRRLSGERPPKKLKTFPQPEIVAMEDRLRRHFGTKVFLHNRANGGGTITIHYYSDEELDALLSNILGKMD
jgi:ParB family chromosome partitioning protein